MDVGASRRSAGVLAAATDLREVTIESGISATSDLGDGITQIRLPMTGNPLRWINGYLIEDAGTYALIDCGWRAPDVAAALDAALAERGLAVADLGRIFITHHHFDHYGLAATLRRRGAGGVVMHRLDWERAQFFDGRRAEMDALGDAWLARNGYTGPPDDDDFDPSKAELAEPTQFAADGERLGRLTAVWTPGHAPGHLCFADARSGRVFTGDHVLDPITPHVGVWFEGAGDPLGDYLASLEKIAAYGAAGALPAHGEPFDDVGRRARAIADHTRGREALMLGAIDAGARSAGDVARAVPWTRRERTLASLSPWHQNFALTETIAHLEHLRVRGVLAREATDEKIRYARA
jgi:glyoxylase-like metal-dependent hydrolase (beta-lactamase superfamily II)